MLTKIRTSLLRALFHIWWAPSFYMMRLVVRLNANHPLRDITDIHRWGFCATPLLQYMNHLTWALIVTEAVAVGAVVRYYHVL